MARAELTFPYLHLTVQGGSVLAPRSRVYRDSACDAMDATNRDEISTSRPGPSFDPTMFLSPEHSCGRWLIQLPPITETVVERNPRKLSPR